MQIITGFHAIEELLRSVEAQLENKYSQLNNSAAKSSEATGAAIKHSDVGGKSASGKAASDGAKAGVGVGKVASGGRAAGLRLKILYAKQGPRVKKILALAEKLSVPIEQRSDADLDTLTAPLPEYLQNHRGIILIDERPQEQAPKLSADALLAALATRQKAFVVVLDSITDPHNTGAIIRSADQFAVDAVVLPERRSAGDFQTVSKISAGAAAWVPLLYTANLVRTVEELKRNGFWVFGADAQGEPLPHTTFPDKTVLIMGSEGSGISRLLKASCDSFTAIPTSGKLDSLNVSVAAGILMYEVRRQQNE